MIVVVINNIETFMDTFPTYEETLVQLTRDCLKYGVVFILSTSSPNSIRYKLKQNFKQNLVLQFNDSSDYMSVLPGVRKKEPSKAYGRGLVDLDNIYEFQTAHPYKEEQMLEFIKVVCKRLNDIVEEKAPRIPVLPEKVTLEYIEEEINGLNNIPIGIEKESLNVAKYNFKDNNMSLVTCEDVYESKPFIEGLINVISKTDTNLVIMDTKKIIQEISDNNIMYDSDDCTNVISKLDELSNLSKNKQVVILAINLKTLLDKLSNDNKNKLIDYLTNSKTNNLNFIIVDNINEIKDKVYEDWFKNNISLTECIWLGNGLNNQFTIKVTNPQNDLKQELTSEFGYVIRKGKATLIKLVSSE